MLAWAQVHPEKSLALLPYLGTDDATLHAVRGLVEAAKASPKVRAEEAERLEAWLRIHDPNSLPSLRDDVQQSSASDDLGDGWESLMAALKREDPARWREVLATAELKSDESGGLRAAAYRFSSATDPEDAASERARERLMAYAATPGNRASLRSMAFEALWSRPWPGQESWALGRFEDPTALHMDEGFESFSPLRGLIHQDPDHWIPLLVTTVESADPVARRMAVSLLAGFQSDEARKDALRPLLPWLSDSEWADYPGSDLDRLRLVQSLDRFPVPEATPGLVRILETSTDDTMLEAAAEAVSHHPDGTTLPALQKALGRVNPDQPEASGLRRVIMRLGGYRDDTLLAAIEAYAAWKAAGTGAERPAPSTAIHIGMDAASDAAGVWERLLPQILARAAALRSRQPARAGHLWHLVLDQTYPLEWMGSLGFKVSRNPSELVDRALVERLVGGDLDAEALDALLRGRRDMAATCRPVLEHLLQVGDWRSGIASVVLGKEGVNILAHGSDGARFALLVAARKAGYPLPAEPVRQLAVGRGGDLALAADRYLEAIDTPEGREAYWSLHPGECRIVGLSREDLAWVSQDPRLSRLLKDLQDDPSLLEAVYLAGGSTWGGARTIIIRRYTDRVTLTKETPDLSRGGMGGAKDGGPVENTKRIDQRAWNDFSAFMKEQRVDDLPPLQQGIMDAMEYQFIHLYRRGGKGFYMVAPGLSESAGSVYAQLVEHIDELAECE